MGLGFFLLGYWSVKKLFRWLTMRDVSLLDVSAFFTFLLFLLLTTTTVFFLEGKGGERKRTKSVEAGAGLVDQYEGIP